MIALLTGRLAHKSPEFIIIDVQGVGYRVHIPFSTYYGLPDEGGEVRINIHTHVKEDAINLYGFLSPAEKRMFQLLISVSGIGPRLGNNILSNIQADELCSSLLQADIVRLSAIPGIGKKTAERLILELREKVKSLGHAEPALGTPKQVMSSDTADDVISALINLGYKEIVVKKVVADLTIGAKDTVEGILKQALKILMK